MSVGNMVHMANQIALFFKAYPRDKAIAGIADHLTKFWEACMLGQLHQYASGGGAGLDPFVIEAERLLSEKAAEKAS